MLRPITIQHPDDDIRIWSDAHFGHNREWIVQARGFATVQEHDAELMARWNGVCNDTTIAFHLGDLTFADPEGKRFHEVIRRLRYRTLYLLWGNHCSGQKQAYTELVQRRFPDLDNHQGGITAEVYPLSDMVDGNPDKTVTFLPQYAEVKVNGQMVVLCHYGIQSWNGMSKSVPMLCGHSHGSLAHQARRRDVGVDCCPAHPPSLKRLLKDMEDEKPAVVDHHGRD